MSPLDVIEIPGYPGRYTRRVVVQMWQDAGSPRIRDAGRLKGFQKDLWLKWQAGVPGYYPADNPDNPYHPCPHVRFVALDVDPDGDKAARMRAAGFVQPFPVVEPWHFQLPNVWQYPLIESIPTPTGDIDMKLDKEDLSAIRSLIRGEAKLYASTLLNYEINSGAPVAGRTIPRETVAEKLRQMRRSTYNTGTPIRATLENSIAILEALGTFTPEQIAQLEEVLAAASAEEEEISSAAIAIEREELAELGGAL